MAASMHLRALAILGLSLLASGCQCYLGRYAVEREYQPSQCLDDWDPVLGSCQACNLCGGDCPGYTPCMYMKHMKTCAAGCGEIYWNEWISDPPDECDPCDSSPQWVGNRCCPPKLHDLIRAGFTGQRSACGPSCFGAGLEDGVPAEEIWYESNEAMVAPGAAGPRGVASPPGAPARPSPRMTPTPAAPRPDPDQPQQLQPPIQPKPLAPTVRRAPSSTRGWPVVSARQTTSRQTGTSSATAR